MKKPVDRRSILKLSGRALGIGVLYQAKPAARAKRAMGGVYPSSAVRSEAASRPPSPGPRPVPLVLHDGGGCCSVGPAVIHASDPIV